MDDADKVEKVDFVWCVGDDIEDEVNFGTIHKYKRYTAPEAKIFNTK